MTRVCCMSLASFWHLSYQLRYMLPTTTWFHILCDQWVRSFTSLSIFAYGGCTSPGKEAKDITLLSNDAVIRTEADAEQRPHDLTTHFQTLVFGPVWGLNPRPSTQHLDPLPTELTKRRGQFEIKTCIAGAISFVFDSLLRWLVFQLFKRVKQTKVTPCSKELI